MRSPPSPSGASQRVPWRAAVTLIARRFLFHFGVAVTAAGLVGALPAQASALTYDANCGTTGYLDYKPSSWSNGCTGGSTNIDAVRWTRWTSTSAHGRGHAHLRDPLCRPSCPEAKVYPYRAAVTLSRPRSCSTDSGQRLRYFSRATVRIRWTRGNPFHKAVGWRAEHFTVPTGNSCELSP